jgi:hypothetical protein
VSFFLGSGGNRRLHPSVIQMLAGNEFRLRQGFAAQNAWDGANAPPAGWPVGCGFERFCIFSVNEAQKNQHRQRLC